MWSIILIFGLLSFAEEHGAEKPRPAAEEVTTTTTEFTNEIIDALLARFDDLNPEQFTLQGSEVVSKE